MALDFEKVQVNGKNKQKEYKFELLIKYEIIKNIWLQTFFDKILKSNKTQ